MRKPFSFLVEENNSEQTVIMNDHSPLIPAINCAIYALEKNPSTQESIDLQLLRACKKLVNDTAGLNDMEDLLNQAIQYDGLEPEVLNSLYNIHSRPPFSYLLNETSSSLMAALNCAIYAFTKDSSRSQDPDLKILLACKEQLASSPEPKSMVELLAKVSLNPDLNLACLKLIKENFQKLLETTGDLSDAKNSLALASSLPTPQLIAFIAALIDCENIISFNDILESGVFRELLVRHCEFDANKVQSLHKIICSLTSNPKCQDFLESLKTISTGLVEKSELTLSGETCQNPNIIQFAESLPTFQLKLSNVKLAYALLGASILFHKDIYSTNNLTALKYLLNNIVLDEHLLATVLHIPSKDKAEMEKFVYTIWLILEHDKRQLLMENPQTEQVLLPLLKKNNLSINRFYDLQTRVNYITNLKDLHDNVKNPLEFAKVLKRMPKEDILIALLNIDYDSQRTILALSLIRDPDPATFLLALQSLPPQFREKLFFLDDTNSVTDSINTMYHLALHPVFLVEALLLLPPEKRLAAILFTPNHKQKSTTLQRLVSQNTQNKEQDILIKVLATIPQKDLLQAVLYKDYAGNNLLHAISKECPASLLRVLELLPQEDRQTAILDKNNFGQSVLFNAALQPQLLEQILAYFPTIEAKLAAVEQTNAAGNTLLHLTAKNNKSLAIILNLYPNDEAKRRAILQKNQQGENALHLAYQDPLSLKLLLEQFSPNERLRVLQERTISYKHTALYWASLNKESLLQVLSLLPEEHRLEALLTPSGCADNISTLKMAKQRGMSLDELLISLPEKDKPFAIKSYNDNTESVLQTFSIFKSAESFVFVPSPQGQANEAASNK